MIITINSIKTKQNKYQISLNNYSGRHFSFNNSNSESKIIILQIIFYV